MANVGAVCVYMCVRVLGYVRVHVSAARLCDYVCVPRGARAREAYPHVPVVEAGSQEGEGGRRFPRCSHDRDALCLRAK